MKKSTINIVGKILLIGLLTTIVRIIGQLLIPAGTQDVLKPSVFVNNGTMPMVFTIYGILVYAIISFMFLLVKDKISGNSVDLLLFNFFMPLVFDADIPDLIIRTCMDFSSVTISFFSCKN